MRLQRQLKTKKRRRQQFNTRNRHNKRCNSKTKTHNNKRKRSHKRKRAQSGGTLTPEQLQLLRANFAPRKRPQTTPTAMPAPTTPTTPPLITATPTPTTREQLLRANFFAPRKPPISVAPPPSSVVPTLTTTPTEQLQLLRANFAPRKPPQKTPPLTTTPPATTTTDQSLRANFAPRKPSTTTTTPIPPPFTSIMQIAPKAPSSVASPIVASPIVASPIVASPSSPFTSPMLPTMASSASTMTPLPPTPPPPPSPMQQFGDKLKEMGVANSYSTNHDGFDSLLKEAHYNVGEAINLYIAQKFSAEMSAASISASGAPTMPIGAPTSASDALNQAYAETPMYLKNPEIFVERYVQDHRIPLEHNEMCHEDVHGRNLFKFAKVFHNWRVLQTVGDGNCLTHAFLQCLSPTYRKIWDPDLIYDCPNKTAVALAFRLDFAKNSPLAVSKQAYNADDGLRDLSDTQITEYSRLFNVITVVFEQKNINPLDPSLDFVNPIMACNLTQYSKPNDTVIFIHGDGMHYSSIMLPNHMFAMTLDEARKIPALVTVLTSLLG